MIYTWHLFTSVNKNKAEKNEVFMSHFCVNKALGDAWGGSESESKMLTDN